MAVIRCVCDIIGMVVGGYFAWTVYGAVAALGYHIFDLFAEGHWAWRYFWTFCGAGLGLEAVAASKRD